MFKIKKYAWAKALVFFTLLLFSACQKRDFALESTDVVTAKDITEVAKWYNSQLITTADTSFTSLNKPNWNAMTVQSLGGSRIFTIPAYTKGVISRKVIINLTKDAYTGVVQEYNTAQKTNTVIDVYSINGRFIEEDLLMANGARRLLRTGSKAVNGGGLRVMDIGDEAEAIDADYSNSTFVAGVTTGITSADYLKCFTDTSSSVYRITVYVKQPIPGTRKTYTTKSEPGTSSSKANVDVGHTFLTLKEVKSDGTIIIRNLGFYPVANVNPMFPSCQGIFFDDSQHPYHVSLTTIVSNQVFTNLIQLINGGPPKYNLNSLNCTSFCINILNSINLTLPATYGSWLLGGGLDPGDLGEDIRNMTLGSGQSRNITGGFAPTNAFFCH
jgi:hypothetical protein